MSEKNMNTRIIHKHDIEANWEKAINFIPKQGEIIIYDVDTNYNYERFKIGDGVTTVNNLLFTTFQADWNQNDEFAPDYIKNRTHYEISGNVIFENAAMDFSEDTRLENELIDLFRDDNKGLVEDVSYKVEFDGNDYYCVAKDTGYGEFYIGNQDIAVENELNRNFPDKIVSNEPFYIMTYDGGWYSYVCVSQSSMGVHSIKIIEGSELKKIDEKYLDIATDDEIIEMLMDTDMFPVVTDSDGSMLANENGDILLW